MADDQPTKPQGVTGPDEKVSVSWLILQRLEDLHDDIQTVKHDTNARIDALRQDVDSFKTSTDRRLDTLQRQWAWAIGLIAVMALGLLANLLSPGA